MYTIVRNILFVICLWPQPANLYTKMYCFTCDDCLTVSDDDLQWCQPFVEVRALPHLSANASENETDFSVYTVAHSIDAALLPQMERLLAPTEKQPEISEQTAGPIPVQNPVPNQVPTPVSATMPLLVPTSAINPVPTPVVPTPVLSTMPLSVPPKAPASMPSLVPTTVPSPVPVPAPSILSPTTTAPMHSLATSKSIPHINCTPRTNCEPTSSCTPTTKCTISKTCTPITECSDGYCKIKKKCKQTTTCKRITKCQKNSDCKVVTECNTNAPKDQGRVRNMQQEIQQIRVPRGNENYDIEFQELAGTSDPGKCSCPSESETEEPSTTVSSTDGKCKCSPETEEPLSTTTELDGKCSCQTDTVTESTQTVPLTTPQKDGKCSCQTDSEEVPTTVTESETKQTVPLTTPQKDGKCSCQTDTEEVPTTVTEKSTTAEEDVTTTTQKDGNCSCQTDSEEEPTKVTKTESLTKQTIPPITSEKTEIVSSTTTVDGGELSTSFDDESEKGGNRTVAEGVTTTASKVTNIDEKTTEKDKKCSCQTGSPEPLSETVTSKETQTDSDTDQTGPLTTYERSEIESTTSNETLMIADVETTNVEALDSGGEFSTSFDDESEKGGMRTAAEAVTTTTSKVTNIDEKTTENDKKCSCQTGSPEPLSETVPPEVTQTDFDTDQTGPLTTSERSEIESTTSNETLMIADIETTNVEALDSGGEFSTSFDDESEKGGMRTAAEAVTTTTSKVTNIDEKTTENDKKCSCQTGSPEPLSETVAPEVTQTDSDTDQTGPLTTSERSEIESTTSNETLMIADVETTNVEALDSGGEFSTSFDDESEKGGMRTAAEAVTTTTSKVRNIDEKTTENDKKCSCKTGSPKPQSQAVPSKVTQTESHTKQTGPLITSERSEIESNSFDETVIVADIESTNVEAHHSGGALSTSFYDESGNGGNRTAAEGVTTTASKVANIDDKMTEKGKECSCKTGSPKPPSQAVPPEVTQTESHTKQTVPQTTPERSEIESNSSDKTVIVADIETTNIEALHSGGALSTSFYDESGNGGNRTAAEGVTTTASKVANIDEKMPEKGKECSCKTGSPKPPSQAVPPEVTQTESHTKQTVPQTTPERSEIESNSSDKTVNVADIETTNVEAHHSAGALSTSFYDESGNGGNRTAAEGVTTTASKVANIDEKMPEKGKECSCQTGSPKPLSQAVPPEVTQTESHTKQTVPLTNPERSEIESSASDKTVNLADIETTNVEALHSGGALSTSFYDESGNGGNRTAPEGVTTTASKVANIDEKMTEKGKECSCKTGSPKPLSQAVPPEVTQTESHTKRTVPLTTPERSGIESSSSDETVIVADIETSNDEAHHSGGPLSTSFYDESGNGGNRTAAEGVTTTASKVANIDENTTDKGKVCSCKTGSPKPLSQAVPSKVTQTEPHTKQTGPLTTPKRSGIKSSYSDKTVIVADIDTTNSEPLHSRGKLSPSFDDESKAERSSTGTTNAEPLNSRGKLSTSLGDESKSERSSTGTTNAEPLHSRVKLSPSFHDESKSKRSRTAGLDITKKSSKVANIDENTTEKGKVCSCKTGSPKPLSQAVPSKVTQTEPHTKQTGPLTTPKRSGIKSSYSDKTVIIADIDTTNSEPLHSRGKLSPSFDDESKAERSSTGTTNVEALHSRGKFSPSFDDESKAERSSTVTTNAEPLHSRGKLSPSFHDESKSKRSRTAGLDITKKISKVANIDENTTDKGKVCSCKTGSPKPLSQAVPPEVTQPESQTKQLVSITTPERTEIESSTFSKMFMVTNIEATDKEPFQDKEDLEPSNDDESVKDLAEDDSVMHAADDESVPGVMHGVSVTERSKVTAETDAVLVAPGEETTSYKVVIIEGKCTCKGTSENPVTQNLDSRATLSDSDTYKFAKSKLMRSTTKAPRSPIERSLLRTKTVPIPKSTTTSQKDIENDSNETPLNPYHTALNQSILTVSKDLKSTYREKTTYSIDEATKSTTVRVPFTEETVMPTCIKVDEPKEICDCSKKPSKKNVISKFNMASPSRSSEKISLPKSRFKTYPRTYKVQATTTASDTNIRYKRNQRSEQHDIADEDGFIKQQASTRLKANIAYAQTYDKQARANKLIKIENDLHGRIPEIDVSENRGRSTKSLKNISKTRRHSTLRRRRSNDLYQNSDNYESSWPSAFDIGSQPTLFKPIGPIRLPHEDSSHFGREKAVKSLRFNKKKYQKGKKLQNGLHPGSLMLELDKSETKSYGRRKKRHILSKIYSNETQKTERRSNRNTNTNHNSFKSSKAVEQRAREQQKSDSVNKHSQTSTRSEKYSPTDKKSQPPSENPKQLYKKKTVKKFADEFKTTENNKNITIRIKKTLTKYFGTEPTDTPATNFTADSDHYGQLLPSQVNKAKDSDHFITTLKPKKTHQPLSPSQQNRRHVSRSINYEFQSDLHNLNSVGFALIHSHSNSTPATLKYYLDWLQILNKNSNASFSTFFDSDDQYASSPYQNSASSKSFKGSTSMPKVTGPFQKREVGPSPSVSQQLKERTIEVDSAPSSASNSFGLLTPTKFMTVSAACIATPDTIAYSIPMTTQRSITNEKQQEDELTERKQNSATLSERRATVSVWKIYHYSRAYTPPRKFTMNAFNDPIKRSALSVSDLRFNMEVLKKYEKPFQAKTVHRFAREVQAGNEFSCYAIKIGERIKRGCVPKSVENPCQALEGKYGSTDCEICYTPGCNKIPSWTLSRFCLLLPSLAFIF